MKGSAERSRGSNGERPDNAHKLGLATAAHERHLLIWVDHARLDVSAAMQVGERKNLLPDPVPDLPCKIDVVWLALAMANPIVWRWDRNDWRSAGMVAPMCGVLGANGEL